MKSVQDKEEEASGNEKKIPNFILFVSLYDEEENEFILEWPYLVFTILKEKTVREEALHVLENQKKFKKKGVFKMLKSNYRNCFWALIKSENGITAIALYAHLNNLQVMKQYLFQVSKTYSGYDQFQSKDLRMVEMKMIQINEQINQQTGNFDNTRHLNYALDKMPDLMIDQQANVDPFQKKEYSIPYLDNNQSNSIYIENSKINIDMNRRMIYLIIGLGAFVTIVILAFLFYRYSEYNN